MRERAQEASTSRLSAAQGNPRATCERQNSDPKRYLGTKSWNCGIVTMSVPGFRSSDDLMEF